MHDEFLSEIFLKFGLAAALGFLIGLEREKSQRGTESPGVRDFVLFAILGAVTAFLADQYENSALILVGFAGLAALLITCYWIGQQQPPRDPGITTESSAMLTFFLGVLVMNEAAAAAIAIAVVVLAVLSQKETLGRFQSRIQPFEINAAVKLLVISFIVLPILPRQTLETLVTFPLGRITGLQPATEEITVELIPGQRFEPQQEVPIYPPQGPQLGVLEVREASARRLSGTYRGDQFDRLSEDLELRTEPGERLVRVALSAINPYKVWLIVVLVSAISFVGYVLVKALGADAGIGLTGLIGGLASSTVTAASFARRSLEAPAWNRHFAVAVILASTVMFPRLLVQIAVVNYALMRNMLLPIGVITLVGTAVAVFYYIRSRGQAVQTEPLELKNPFSLKSALTFAAIFGTTLIVTRVALEFLGKEWLPLIATLSGLTDADAIAFSISDAQAAGLITLDWASFNLVLGALSNTVMKLFLVLLLGHRHLFRGMLAAFVVIAASGVIAMFLYYDLRAMLG